IGAVTRAAVANKMFGRGDDVVRPEIALQSFDQRRAQVFYNLRRFRVTLVGAAPAHVSGDCDGGRESPVQAGYGDFTRGNLADSTDQISIVGRAQADVMREQSGSREVVMAVHGIGAPKY